MGLEYRPRLTEPEVKALVQILKAMESISGESEGMAKHLKNEASDASELKKWDEELWFERRRKMACKGLAQRFQDLLDGKKRGRIKKDSRFAQLACLFLKE